MLIFAGHPSPDHQPTSCPGYWEVPCITAKGFWGVWDAFSMWCSVSSWSGQLSCSLEGLDWKCHMKIAWKKNAFTTGAMCPESQCVSLSRQVISLTCCITSCFAKMSILSAHIGKTLGCKQAAFGLEESTLNCSFVFSQAVWVARCSTSNQLQFAYMHPCKWRVWSPFKNRGIWGPGCPKSALGFSFGSGRAIAWNQWGACLVFWGDLGSLRLYFLFFLAQDAI